jgi:amidohydrolase
MNELIKLRHKLHAFPELSGKEIYTAETIYKFLLDCNPDHILKNVGGNGVLAAFESGQSGDTVLFRADIDALPIQEDTKVSWKSVNPGISHKCGHDGHSAILAGLAKYIGNFRPKKGKAILFFQPSEENGVGANKALSEPNFPKLDYAFALHNLPGFPLNSIILNSGTFASASKGIIIKLIGKSSHASEPEKGLNPANALASLIQGLSKLNELESGSSNYSMVTVIHCRLGVESFGTSPGDAVVMATLRGSSDDKIKYLDETIGILVNDVASSNSLSFEISYTEDFPATLNDHNAVKIVRDAAIDVGHKIHELSVPFRWSEDFGHFGRICKSALFGIGAGEDQLPLHNPDYDFPDEIIPTGVEIWKAIYSKILL